ncbi:MAG: FtsX-like permease family protein [Gaiellaceae bacterium]
MTGTSVRRRVTTPLGVALARLHARPGRNALAALGVAASLASIVAVDGGSVIARDRAVQRAVAALPPSQRTFRVDAFGLAPDQNYAQANRTMTQALLTLTPQAPIRATFFRELRVGGSLVQLGALDLLDRLVRVRAGRLPRSCTPVRCEVLELGRGTQTEWTQPGVHLVRVGVGDLVDRAQFGDSLVGARALNGQVATILLAAGATAYERLPALDGIYRAFSWIAPIDPSRLHVWEISALLQRESVAQSLLGRHSDAYELSGPDQALTDAQSRGRVATQRLLLVGGEVGALLLGFALIAAIGLRRGLAAERRRLQQRGALTAQLWLALVGEIAPVTFAGAVIGTIAGGVAVALVAAQAGLPIGAVLARSLGSSVGAGLVAGAWLAATLAVIGAVAARGSPSGRVRPLDVAALGAALALAVGLARGAASTDSIASGADRTLFLLLPVLTCFVAAVLVGRLLAPSMRVAERAARRGPLSVRLALLALARAPSRTVATTAFLVVGVGLALFAASYRATLERGARDEAAFAVPLDYALTESDRLVPPATLRVPGTAYPVLRLTANVPGSGTTVLSPTVLGLPMSALARLHWRSDFSTLPRAELVRRLGAVGPAVLQGPAVHGRVTLRVRIDGVAVRLDVAVRAASGNTTIVPLGERGRGSWTLAARVPRGTFAGLEISLAAAEQLGYSHREAEAGAAAAPRGSLTLANARGWVARGGAQIVGDRVSYAFTSGQTFLLRPPQVTDGRPLRVVVSPDVARSAGPRGSLTLDFQDQQVPARIVGVAARFPAAEQSGEGFVVAEESNLATVLDARQPGTGAPTELWLAGGPRLEPALEQLPVAVASRRDLERGLATDPLARGLILTLAAGALVALALAALGFWLALVNDLRDERGELFDLEAQGVEPATLRGELRARGVVLLALGVAGGTLLGTGLSRLVVAIVRVSAATQQPQPPLRFEPAWPIAATGIAVFLAIAAVLAELTVRRAFRGDTPARASWSLE